MNKYNDTSRQDRLAEDSECKAREEARRIEEESRREERRMREEADMEMALLMSIVLDN